MSLITEDKIVTFSVRFYDKSIGLDEDVIEVIYDNYKFALQGQPKDFESIIQKLLDEIKKEAA